MTSTSLPLPFAFLTDRQKIIHIQNKLDKFFNKFTVSQPDIPILSFVNVTEEQGFKFIAIQQKYLCLTFFRKAQNSQEIIFENVIEVLESLLTGEECRLVTRAIYFDREGKIIYNTSLEY